MGNFRIEENGVFVFGKRFQKELFIEWEEILKVVIRARVGRVWFRDKSGDVRIRKVIGEERELKDLKSRWDDFLLGEYKRDSFLEGSFAIREKTEWWEKGFLYLGMIYVLYYFGEIFYGAYKNIHKIYKYQQELFSDIAPILFSVLIIFVLHLVGILSLVIFYKIKMAKWKKWRKWKITPDGLYYFNTYQEWEAVQFKKGDKINQNEVIIGGEQIPVRHMTNNGILLDLLTILAEKEGIIPKFDKILFKNESLRIIFLWPAILTAFLYLPFLIVGYPPPLSPQYFLHIPDYPGFMRILRFPFFISSPHSK